MDREPEASRVQVGCVDRALREVSSGFNSVKWHYRGNGGERDIKPREGNKVGTSHTQTE